MDVSVEHVLERSRELFGDNHAVVAGVLYSWAANLRAVGRADEAAPVLEKALELYRAAYGRDHASVGVALGALSEVSLEIGKMADAERYGREALELQQAKFGEGSLQVAEALDRLTECLTTSTVGDRNDEIGEVWAQTVAAYRAAVGDDDPRTVKELCSYGAWLYQRGRFDEAGTVLVEAAERARTVLAGGDNSYAEAMAALLNLRATQGDVDAMHPLFDQLLEAIVATHGEENPVLIMVKSNYGVFLLRMGEFARAEEILVEAVDAAREQLEPGDQARITALDCLTQVYASTDEVAKAAPVYKQVIAEGRIGWGEDNPQFVRSLVTYGRWLHRAVRDEVAAERTLREALSLADAVFDEPEMAVLQARERLVTILQNRQGRDPEAREEIRHQYLTMLDEGRRIQGLPSSKIEEGLEEAGGWLVDNAFYTDAEPILIELVTTRRANAPDSAALASALIRLGQAKMGLDELAEAETLLNECLSIRRAILPDGHWLIGNTMSMLGECLTAQRRYEDAESLVLDGYRTLRDHPQTPASRLRRGLERVSSLYEAWGRPEEAARWQGG
jgi:tetratricopeptide (TPR) repeat protein